MTGPAAPAGPLAGARIVVANWRDIDHALAGGAEIYAWHVARALREAGAEVRFLTSREPGQARREQREQITVHRGGHGARFYPAALGWLLRHRRGIDLVVDPAGGLPTFSPLVLRRGTPAVLVVHHVHQAQFGVHFPAPVAAFGRWLERVAMRRVYRDHATVAVSQSTRQEMRGQLGWAGPVGILANGADLASYRPGSAGSKDPDRVVVLGRLAAHKRVDLALEAVARVRATSGRDVRVDVIGRGSDRDRLVAHAHGLGLAEAVTFHGFLPSAERDALLGRAAVHVCASDAEGWGQTVIDAAGFGTPTLARDVPGLRDSIQPGETGWLVPDAPAADVLVAGLAEGLGAALREAADPATRIARAEACVAWARTFDWSQMHVRACDLITEVLIGDASASADDHHPRDVRVAV